MKNSKKTEGRAPIVFLLFALTVMCSLGVAAQDKLLTNTTSNNSSANAATVNCAQYAADGVTCIAGQYYHSDGAQWYGTWNPIFVTTSPRKFGGYKAYASGDTPASNTPSSPCWGCHHGNATNLGNYVGANYMVGGHKNMLRKVAPGKAPYNLEGFPLFSENGFADASGNMYDWTNATITLAGTTTPLPLYYLFGWIDEPDTLYQGGGNGSAGFNYQCARCHTTGYRFDNKGPEPTDYNLNPISDANLSRYPASGGRNQGETTSWYLSGIQCERCHQADMQFDATVYNPNYNNSGTPAPTQGRISHLVNVDAASTLPPSFLLGGTSGYVRPLPKVPVNERSTALCIQCHRQEVSKPGTGGVLGITQPTQLPGFTLGIPGIADGAFKSGGKCSDNSSKTYAECVAAGLTYGPYKPSMSHGANGAQAFLNSPHARFSGTLAQTAQNSPDLSVTMTGTYNSHFTDWGEAPGARTAGVPDATKNGGCAGCHDVHNTLLDVNATPVAAGIVKKCTDCHSEHGQAVAHPTGPGTPFPSGSFGELESCVICHMGGANGSPAYHYFRINEDPNYNTFPSADQYYSSGGGNQQPNTYPESAHGQTYNAVALDVDIACGQCHTGGNGSNPYGIALPDPVPGGMVPVAYSRAFLAEKAINMHNTQAPAPTLNPAPGTFLSGSTPVLVTISSVAGTTIYYTTNGTTPTTSSTVYTGPIAVNSTTTIYAIAAGQSWSYKPSTVAGGAYTIQTLAKPTFLPSQGNYTTTSASVTLSGPSGSTMYYTKDGSTPTFPVTGTTTQYTGPIVLNAYTILKAIAVAPGYAPSAVATSGAYTFKLATPTFSNVGAKYPGSYSLTANGGSITVKLNDANAAATICYTTNGTTPTAAAGVCTNGTSMAAGGTFTLSTPGVVTVRAIAAAPNYTNSNMVSGTYSLY